MSLAHTREPDAERSPECATKPAVTSRKRHVAFRDNGTLLTEEVMGFEGFSGNESILYHLQTPCRVTEVGAFEPLEREEWVPEAHCHHLFSTRGLSRRGRSGARAADC